MLLSVDRTMKWMKGGGIIMKSQSESVNFRGAPQSVVIARRTCLRTRAKFCNRIKSFGAQKLDPVVAGAAVWGRLWQGERRVWTVSTLCVSDWAVRVPDWAGLRRFSGEWRICKAWNPVRSHLGHSVSAVQ